jgi:hypothetical protein
VGAEPDESRGERIVAFGVLADGGSLDRLTAFVRIALLHAARQV